MSRATSNRTPDRALPSNTSRTLRNSIVFISSHTEYSIDGYEVNALCFIDKNSSEFIRRFFECMDKTAYCSEEYRRTVIMVTHYQGMANYADRIIRISDDVVTE